MRRFGRADDGNFVRSEVVRNIDMFATFLDMAGIRQQTQSARDGRSILPLIRNQGQPGWRNAALVEHRKAGAAGAGEVDPDVDETRAAAGNAEAPSYQAIRTRTELFVQYETGAARTTTDADPHQTNNLPGDPRADRPARALTS